MYRIIRFSRVLLELSRRKVGGISIVYRKTEMFLGVIIGRLEY